MINKRFTTDISGTEEPKQNNFHIATTQLAVAENTAINELPLIYDSMKNENETSFYIKKNDFYFEENGKRVAVVSFNDKELLKSFKDKRTSENIEHLEKRLIDIVYKSYYLKTKKQQDDLTIIIKDEDLKKTLNLQHIQEVISFMCKFKLYIDNCTVSTYEEDKRKYIMIPKFFIGNNFEDKEKESGKRITKREWTFLMNKQYFWNDYLVQYIDLPPYFSTYKGLKWNIIKSIYRQIRIRKKIPIEIPIRDLIATSSILNSKGNQRNRKKRIIEPIIKAIQEINADANNNFIEIDASKIINLAYDAFLNTKVEVKAKAKYTEMIGYTLNKLRKSAEKAKDKAKK